MRQPPPTFSAHRALLAAALALSGCAGPASSTLHAGAGQGLSGAAAVLDAGVPGRYAPGRTYRLTLLHTNDSHGRYWRNADGEGGMAARSTLIARIRAEVQAQGGQVLLIDAGDVNTGVPESDLHRAEPDFRGLAAMGYHSMTVGNHEFDKPGDALMQQAQWAPRTPLLSANIYRDGQRVFAPYTVLRLGDLNVAVMGLTTPDTVKLVMPAHVEGLVFKDSQQEARELVPQLRRKADVVIAATHLGYYEDDKSGHQAPGDVELARAVPGIDLIVGGHSHTPVCMKGPNQLNTEYRPGQPCQPDVQGQTLIMQAGQWGRYLGRADLEFKDARLRLLSYQLIPVNLKTRLRDASGKTTLTPVGETIAEDPQMLQLLEPYQAEGQALLSRGVGQLEGDLDVQGVRQQANALGRLVAHSQRQAVGADLAITNSGGVRDSLRSGTITYRDVLRVLPFGNTIARVDLTGEELLAVLRTVARMTPGSGGYPQLACVDWRMKEGQLDDVRVAGQPLDPQRSYRLAVNQFMAAGGDGYPKLALHPSYVDTGTVDADALRSQFARASVRATDFAEQNPEGARCR